MKSKAFAIVTTFAFALAAVASDEEIKFRSPDGKLALSVKPTQTSIVKLPSHEVVIEVDEMGAPFLAGKRLVWSADSNRVAYYSPNRRGGLLSVYFRKGDSFESVDIPDLPLPKFSSKHSEKCEVVSHIDLPLRWLPSGSLVIYSEVADECDNTAASEVTLAFERDGTPKVKKAIPTAVRRRKD